MSRITNQQLYDLYKPLRNHLMPVAIENAFYVIWAYVNHFQYENPFPIDIQVHESVVNAKDITSRSVHEWELSLIAREIIVCGQRNLSLGTKNFNNWGYFANAMNKLKEFENNAWPIFGSDSNIRKEIRRTAHRQFPWQTKVTVSDILRYYKIYNSPRIADIVKEIIGLTVQEWYTVGTAVFADFITFEKVNIDSKIDITGLSKREFDIFFSLTSQTVENIKDIIERDVRFDDEYIYTFNPLEYYPLVIVDEYYYCPLITFLMWRITSGLYFDLVKDKNFGHKFGFAFQGYIEEVSNKILERNKTVVKPEQEYAVGKNKKDSIDIIISQDDAAFFVEAKAKRLQARSKCQLLTDSAIEKDLNVLADDVVQVYKTICDYKDGHYPHFAYKSDRAIYPLIVTLEDWYLIGEDVFILEDKVKEKLVSNGLPENYITDMPYTVCSIKNYEMLMQFLNKHSIKEVMNDWVTPERKGHNFGQFLVTHYSEGCKPVNHFFPGEFEKIYPKELMRT